MKTAMINNTRQKITYRTNTGVYTRLTNSSNNKTAQYGADVYDSNDGKNIVLVATAHDGSTLNGTVTVIKTHEYNKLAELHDSYNSLPFHFAIMSELGFQ